MFFSVSFYFCINLLHLVECGNVCDPEKSDTETKPHFCNYFLITPSTIKVTWWVSPRQVRVARCWSVSWGCKQSPAGVYGLETWHQHLALPVLISLGKGRDFVVIPHYDGHIVIINMSNQDITHLKLQCFLLSIYSVFSMKTVLVEPLSQLYRHSAWHLSVYLVFCLASVFARTYVCFYT